MVIGARIFFITEETEKKQKINGKGTVQIVLLG